MPKASESRRGGSYLSASDPRLHFGLGNARMAEIIEVRWPSGARDLLREVELDRQITVREGDSVAVGDTLLTLA